MTGCIFLFTSRWAYSRGPGEWLISGGRGRFMSESLLYGLCQLQCPDYFSGLKPQAVERCFKTRTSCRRLFENFLPSTPTEITFEISFNLVRS